MFSMRCATGGRTTNASDDGQFGTATAASCAPSRRLAGWLLAEGQGAGRAFGHTATPKKNRGPPPARRSRHARRMIPPFSRPWLPRAAWHWAHGYLAPSDIGCRSSPTLFRPHTLTHLSATASGVGWTFQRPSRNRDHAVLVAPCAIRRCTWLYSGSGGRGMGQVVGQPSAVRCELLDFNCLRGRTWWNRSKL